MAKAVDCLATRSCPFGLAQARAEILGLVPSARGRGISKTLMQATLAKAWAKGFSRIELTLRTDNLRAKALYERMGFRTEGLNQRVFFVDGKFYDAYSMALLR